ncbi:MAG: universal stress protein [Chloroflexi bacterium]|nr:universal stress protein [Chloroflexota bacterium]
MYKRILVPLDGSALGGAVVPCVVGLAKRFDAELVLLTVIPPEGFPEAEEFAREEHVRDTTALVRLYLERKAEALSESGVKVSIAIVEGLVADEIIKYVEEHDVDLIAMSTHGRSGIARMVMGSTTDRVLRGTNVPVFLVRSATVCD